MIRKKTRNDKSPASNNNGDGEKKSSLDFFCVIIRRNSWHGIRSCRFLHLLFHRRRRRRFRLFLRLRLRDGAENIKKKSFFHKRSKTRQLQARERFFFGSERRSNRRRLGRAKMRSARSRNSASLPKPSSGCMSNA